MLRDNCPLVHRTPNHPFPPDLRNIPAATVTVRLFPMASINMTNETDIVVVEVVDDKIVAEVSVTAEIS